MSDTTGTRAHQDVQRDLERAKQEASHVAERARERGREQIDFAKDQLAERAERVAEAVESAADDIESNGDGAVSGYGRSLASMMRQLAGGLRERDVDEFASELASFARRNPGAFLAGSVALGFGLSRFLKASPRRSAEDYYGSVDEGYDDDFMSDDDESAAEELAAFGGDSPEQPRESTIAGGTATPRFDSTSGDNPPGGPRDEAGLSTSPSSPDEPSREAGASDPGASGVRGDIP